MMAVLNRELQSAHDMSLAESGDPRDAVGVADGSLRMSDLADGVLSSRSRLTHQIRRMETEGMVERSQCVEDGRGVLAVITDEGRRRLSEAAPTHLAGVRHYLINLLDKQEMRVLANVFDKVDNAIGDRAVG
ncbi:MarR family transcriptional regulator [Rhodococcus hoagii]|nr:MarR family transcriptional regulator [Prescottella equi]